MSISCFRLGDYTTVQYSTTGRCTYTKRAVTNIFTYIAWQKTSQYTVRSLMRLCMERRRWVVCDGCSQITTTIVFLTRHCRRFNIRSQLEWHLLTDICNCHLFVHSTIKYKAFWSLSASSTFTTYKYTFDIIGEQFYNNFMTFKRHYWTNATSGQHYSVNYIR